MAEEYEHSRENEVTNGRIYEKRLAQFIKFMIFFVDRVKRAAARKRPQKIKLYTQKQIKSKCRMYCVIARWVAAAHPTHVEE